MASSISRFTPGRPGSAVGARTPGGPGTPGGTPPAVPVPGATPPAGSRRGGPSRRRRGPLVALTALLVAVLAGVTLVVVRFVDRETPAPQPVVAVPGPCDTSKGDLVIGVIVSQTGEAAEGLGGRPNGADLALRQANERCAVPGHKLVARLVDDRSTTDGAASAAKELAGEPNLVGVVLSTQYADVAQSAQAALAELDTATVAAWNSSAPLTLGDDFLVAARRPAPWFFRIVAPDSTVGRFAADEIVRLGGRRSVAVVDDDRDQGRTVADAFARHAAELGAKIVARERLSGDDPGPVVERLRKAERPDIIFYGGVPATGGKLSAQVGKAGLNVPVASGVYDTSFVDNGARTGDQAFYFTLPRTAIASEYDTAYKRAGYPDSISNVSALVYDATNVVVAGVADAVAPTGDWSTERRTAVVAAVQRSRTDGVTGLLAFDEFGDLTEPRLTEFEVRDGQLEAVVTRTYR